MSETYDGKNEEDFHNNTDLLVQKIDEIENNSELKTTIAQLSKLTGLHRNTISDRGWPATQLKEIKGKRAKTKVTKKVKEKSELQILIQKLDNTQKELVYWYRRCQEKENDLQQLQINYTRMTDSKNSYMQLLNDERQKTAELKKRVNLFNEVLND